MLEDSDSVFKSKGKFIFIRSYSSANHKSKNCLGSRTSNSNVKFWTKKLDGNVVRDKSTFKRLKKLGWQYLIVWECKINSRENDLKRKIKLFLND